MMAASLVFVLPFPVEAQDIFGEDFQREIWVPKDPCAMSENPRVAERCGSGPPSECLCCTL